jgi:PAS domain S-box-containing protein
MAGCDTTPRMSPVTFHSVTRWSALIAALIGLAVLVGWTLEASWLKSLLPGTVYMKSNAALCLVLSALALWLLDGRKLTPGGRWTVLISAGISGLVGFATLIEYLTGWNLGLDQLLFREPAGVPATSHPNRMAPNAAAAFVLAAAAVMFLAVPRAQSRLRLAAVALAAGVVALAGVSLLGHASHLTAAYRWWNLTAIAPNTALALMILGTGLLAAAVGGADLRWAINPSVTVLFVVVLLLILALNVITHRYSVGFVRSAESVFLSQLVDMRLQRLQAASHAADSAAHGFVLTGDERFAADNVSAVSNLTSQASALRSSASQDAIMRSEVAELIGVLQEDKQNLDGLIATRRQGGAASSTQLEKGAAVSRDISARIERIERLNAARMDQHTRGSIQIANRTFLVLPIGTVVALVLLSAVLLLLNRETDRLRRSEAGLREGEQRFRSLVNATSSLVWTTDPAGNVSGPLPGWQEYTGQSDEEVLGAGWVKALHPDDVAPTMKAWQDSVATGSPYEVAYRIRRWDGEYRQFLARGVPVVDPAGNFREWVGTCTDIHDKHLAEEAARQSDERLKTSLAAAGVGAWSWVADQGLLRVDHRMTGLLGLDDDDALIRIRDFLRRVDAADRKRLIEQLQASLGNGAPLETEFRVGRSDGAAHWVAVRGKVHRDGQNRPIRVAGVAWDVTPAKEAEVMRARLAAIVESTSDAVVGKTLDGTVVSWNPGAERLFGYTAAEMIGQSMGRLIPSGQSEEEVGILRRIARGERIEHYETQRVRRDGCLVAVSVAISPVRDGRGAIIGVSSIARDISVQRQAQQQLEESEARHRAILETSLDGVISIDRKGRILEFNAAAERIFGHRAEEVVGRDMAELIIPAAMRERHRRGMDHFLRTGEGPMLGQRLELTALRQDGTEFPVELSITPSDQGGTPIFTGFIRDITDRRQAEQALIARARQREAAGRLAQLALTAELPDLFEQATEIVANTLDTELCKVLERLPDRSGLRLVAGVGWRNGLVGHVVVPPDAGAQAGYPLLSDAPVVMEELARETRFKGPALLTDHAVVSGLSVVIRGARGLWGVLGAYTRKRRNFSADDVGFFETIAGILGGAIERSSVETALRESEERLRRSVEEAPIPMIIHDEDDRILQLSRGWTKFSGYSQSDLPTLSDWTEKAYGSRSGSEKAYIDNLFEIGETVHNGEWTVTAKDGSKRIWDFQTTPLGRFSGGRRALLSLAVDITERKQAEEQIRELNADLERRVRERTAELEAANRELESFSYSVSHDLRAPLRGVHGFVRMLEEDYAQQLDDEGRRMLGIVGAEARRMGQLIDDLLAFSRLDLSQLARDSFENLSGAYREHPAELILAPLPPAWGDPALLRQVFDNLLGNALKFSRHNPAPRIEVGCEPGNGEATYFVKDNGVGFDERYADKLFGVFQRLHSEEEFEGTGVGLAFVQRVIQRHGGRADATAKPGEGARFQFTLPAAKPDL